MSEPNEYTAFIDLLGFSSYVLENIDSHEKGKPVFDYFKTINKKIEEYYVQDIELMRSAKYVAHYTMLSDAVVLTLKPTMYPYANVKNHNQSGVGLFIIANIISEIALYAIQEFKLPIRGGISIKKTFWENGNAIGPGLIEAYALESKEAIYPRVILSNELAQQVSVLQVANTVHTFAGNVHVLDLIENDVCDSRKYLNFYAKTLNTAVAAIADEDSRKKQGIHASDYYRDLIQSLRKDVPDSEKYSDEQIVNLGIRDLKGRSTSLLGHYKKVIVDNIGTEGLQIKYNWLKNFHNKSITKANQSYYVELDEFKIN